MTSFLFRAMDARAGIFLAIMAAVIVLVGAQGSMAFVQATVQRIAWAHVIGADSNPDTPLASESILCEIEHCGLLTWAVLSHSLRALCRRLCQIK